MMKRFLRTLGSSMRHYGGVDKKLRNLQSKPQARLQIESAAESDPLSPAVRPDAAREIETRSIRLGAKKHRPIAQGLLIGCLLIDILMAIFGHPSWMQLFFGLVMLALLVFSRRNTSGPARH